MAAAAVGVLALASPALATVRHVHPGQSIQAAINHAHAGDVIHLAAGDYHQNVTIQKSGITLEGSGPGPNGSRILPSAHPVASPCSGPGVVHGICIAGPAARVSGTVIRGLSVHRFSGVGVLSFHAAHTTVRNVLTAHNGSYGISGFDLTGVVYTNDVALHNGEPGFYVGDSPHANAIVTGNRAHGIGDERFGFFFRDSEHGLYAHNLAKGNCVGIMTLDTGCAGRGRLRRDPPEPDLPQPEGVPAR